MCQLGCGFHIGALENMGLSRFRGVWMRPPWGRQGHGRQWEQDAGVQWGLLTSSQSQREAPLSTLG